MARTFTSTDLELLGYSQAKPVHDVNRYWAIYEASAIAGLEELSATFVYLKAECTVDRAKDVAVRVRGAERLYVVYPESVRIRRDQIKGIFPNLEKDFVHESLIWEKLEGAFSGYLNNLAQNIPAERNYVTPRKEGAKADHALDGEILDYLKGKDALRHGRVMVVSASAGVGKTTLARHVVRDLASSSKLNKLIPVFVEANHWSKLQLDSIDALWEIIKNSLSTYGFSAPIREEMFNYALRQGYIVFVFDGFDELCSHRHSQFRSAEVLRDVCNLASGDAEARIVLTTRTLYWESEIVSPPANVDVLKLAPFNKQQALEYFRKCFQREPNLINQANNLYAKLVSSSVEPRTSGGSRAQFANLPYVVALLADYVKTAPDGVVLWADNEAEYESAEQLLEQVLLQFCERECTRKSLKTMPEHQLVAFQEIAGLDIQVDNPVFDLGLLPSAGFRDEDLSKVGDHPLLDRISSGEYRFRFEFLASYLRARLVLKSLRDVARGGGALPSPVNAIMEHEANGRGFVLDHVTKMLGPTVGLGVVERVYGGVPGAAKGVKSFLFHLAHSLVDDPGSEFVTAGERCAALLKSVGGVERDGRLLVTGLFVSGAIERLEFSSVTFMNCVFQDVSFSRCKVGDNVVFEKTTFSGDLIFGDEIDSWATVSLSSNCAIYGAAKLAWDHVKKGAIRAEDVVKDLLALALGKFWHSGRLKATIRGADWNKGVLAETQYSGKLRDVMLRVGLMSQEHASGVDEGVLVFDRDSIPELQRFMDSRDITGKILKAYEQMIRDAR